MTLKPAYLRYIFILQGLVLLVAVLWWLSAILVPFGFAAILAVLLNPVNNWLMRKRMPRLLAISLTVTLGILVVAGLLYFLIVQATQFADAIPQLQQRVNEYQAELQTWLRKEYNISRKVQLQYFQRGMDTFLTDSGTYALSVLTALSDAALILTIIPVYIFLLLLYKPNLVHFIRQVFATERTSHSKVGEILTEVKVVVQAYMSGMLIEAAIIALLNVGALLILGIPYALLLGVLAAILNMIPYIGGIIGTALPMFIAVISTPDGLADAAGVLIAFLVIQFLDNNIIQPRIVASKVRINALFTVIAVLAGNMLWGVGGMFLAIPIIAILKIIFDRVEELQPYGMLLGDQIPGVDETPSLNEARRTVARDEPAETA